MSANSAKAVNSHWARRNLLRGLLTGCVTLLALDVSAQFCRGATTYFSSNYSLPSCTVGTCWAPSPFAGSTVVTGSTYPSINYACATGAPVAGALENTLYTYDGSGNLIARKDPLGRTTSSTFDALNRLTQVLDPASGSTRYAYSGNGVLRQVIDPRNLATNFTLNGFGETTILASPDTGSTTNTYDAAGNLLNRLDARGVLAKYTYDALNRATLVVYSKTGTPSETHRFEYDGGAGGAFHAKGRLTNVADPAGLTSWSYQAHGRVTSKTQVASGISKTVSYAYNSAGQLQTLTTPSGQQIGYSYGNNRVSGISINGTPLITGALSEPFGPLAIWQWGNGIITLRNYDLDGRLSYWEVRNGSSLLRNDFTWDLAGRVVANANPADAALGCSFHYDALDRLTVSQKGNPITSTQQFSYDSVGNRLNFTVRGMATNYSYAASSNHVLALTGATSRNYVYDAAGNPTTIGSLTHDYNNANRLVSVKSGGTTLASYKLNALGQRVEKVASGTTTGYVYDEQGRLLGEYDGTGQLIQETVWLDELPIATLRPIGTGMPTPIAVYYVHVDHLGSPRAVTRPSDNAIMWRWDNTDPFGNNAANEDPTGQGTFTYGLRFPGQYYDTETATHYNYFRDYDPSIGRYVQSDPIGLNGGLNTYSYSMNRPINDSDPSGLAVWLCERSTSFQIGNHSYFFDDKTKQCCGRSPGKDPLRGCKEPGPRSHFCILISSSDDISKQLFDCCAHRAKQGPYFPGINDCQDATDDCIRDIQRAPPPGISRFGPCNSCWRQ